MPTLPQIHQVSANFQIHPIQVIPIPESGKSFLKLSAPPVKLECANKPDDQPGPDNASRQQAHLDRVQLNLRVLKFQVANPKEDSRTAEIEEKLAPVFDFKQYAEI